MRFFGNSWDNVLDEEFQKEYFTELLARVDEEYQTRKIYPPREKIFSAFKLCDFKDIKVVLLGQDPYHGEGQAHGLCFSVMPGVVPPPSLKNIYKELEEDCGCYIPNNGNLTKWAKQGVLLLNTTLTVREASPQSHKGKGWEILTDRIIELMNEKERPVVFMLWGGNARAKKALITNKHHLVLECAHPSPLSAYAGFFGSNHFGKANEYLLSRGEAPIDWARINN